MVLFVGVALVGTLLLEGEGGSFFMPNFCSCKSLYLRLMLLGIVL